MTVRAQYDVSFAHYWTMEPSFNPAAVGKEAKLNITGAYAIQMAGFENNPKTMYAAADMPFYVLKSYHGVGLQFMNDAIGLFTHKRFSLQYAYQPKLWGGRLSMGVQFSMLSENFDGSKADVIDDDPVFNKSSVDGSAFDIGLGLYYQRREWYAGVSVLHVTSPRVELGEKNQLDINATYYLTGGYNIQLRNPFLSIQTSFSDVLTGWLGGEISPDDCSTRMRSDVFMRVSPTVLPPQSPFSWAASSKVSDWATVMSSIPRRWVPATGVMSSLWDTRWISTFVRRDATFIRV